jgi:hypothetical protein
MRLEKSSQPNDETESALYSDTSPDGSPFRAIESITGGQRDRAKFVTAKFPHPFNALPWQHACRWGVSSGCHGNALPSVMKPVANLDKNFAGIQIMRSAKSEAVIQ